MSKTCYKCGATSTLFMPPFTFCLLCRALLDTTEPDGKANAIDVSIVRKKAFRNIPVLSGEY